MNEPLVDDGRQYAASLEDADVPVSLCVYAGMIHEFLRMGNMVAEAGEARARIAGELARAMRA
ncbi:alpha/beta hydrolase [Achromobacter denitrificans]|uniref:alpha/beta hydrolase n=1 Tax=Achromobacter denitrificans TaxID=32002 RepID=UPI001E4FA1EB|nr:alpha/beta hydrolase fold domain-containing protein [Achromobacter denitrificans]